MNSLLSILFFFLLRLLIPCNSQSPSPASVDGFNCSSNRTIYPCQAYALYRAGLGPGPQDLVSVGDLFGISRLMVARSSNLTISASPRLGEPLLIPLSCDCLSSYKNHSYFPVEYQINAGDTYYILSTTKFQNLTQYQAVEIVNPTLVPTNLTIGVMVDFPIFCQCPKPGDNVTSFVTYVVQPSDSYASIATNFGTDVNSLVSFNGAESLIQPFSTILVPLSKVPPPILLNSSSGSPLSPAPSPSTPPVVVSKNDRNGLITGLAVALGIVGALLLFSLVLIWRSFVLRERGEEKGAKGNNGEARFGRNGSGNKLMMDITEWLDKYKVFKLEELQRATQNFDSSHVIQGTVYKASIDGEVFAVKKMKWNACEELKILQKVNHTNLVKLEGFCIDSESGTCYLVYEYLENGSLDLWLHDSDRARKLNWHNRLRIALDLANGLQYIHEHTWPRVVHKDITSSNVLLDSTLAAKIANFGLAKTGHNAVTTHIVGTQGYIAPEYLSDGLVTTKMDVFAYGVVLLELISGKEAMSAEGEALWMEAEVKIFNARDGRKEGRIRAWMDQALVDQTCPIESVVSVVNVAKACLHKDPSKRPSMVDVCYTLSKADEVFADYSGESLPAGDADVFAR